VVLAGATLRLALYAEAYGLTRFRVATVYWLALVALGLVLVAVRIRGGRPFGFLLDANARATVIVLSLWALSNVDGFVAGWNVDRYLEEPARGIDVGYLRHLGGAAMPSLARLSRAEDAEVAARARAALRALRARAEAPRPWPSWSLRSTVDLSGARK
jgi:hypothetical protein